MTRQGLLFSSIAMKNPFLIARFVSFAVLTYLTILLLTFAAWNIHAITSFGSKAPSAPVFIMLNACITLLCLLLGVIEMFIPNVRISTIRFECVWSGAISLLQTGMAFCITISGPESCGLTATDWASCASSSLLVPVLWLICVILLSYFSMLIIVAMTHVRPNIWESTVYDISWFEFPPFNQLNIKADDCEANWQDERSSHTGYEHGNAEKAPWAATAIRRGKDHPFMIQTKTVVKVDNMPELSIPSPLTKPPQVHGKVPCNGSRFVEIMNDPSKESCRTVIAARFPSTMTNHDLPIPLPRRSEWVQAGVLTGS